MMKCFRSDKMTKKDSPRVQYQESYENNESNAEQVYQIFEELQNFIGMQLNEGSIHSFKSKLSLLLNHVTLIHHMIIPNFYLSDHKQYSEKLVYFFREDVIQLWGYLLLINNGLNDDNVMHNYHKFQADCIENHRCLVFNIIDSIDERHFEVNWDLSNFDEAFSIAKNGDINVR